MTPAQIPSFGPQLADYVDNCVVSVHLCYNSFDTHFRTMLDSDLFLPERGWDDPARREEAGIPDGVVHRPKYEFTLDQLRHALTNGIRFGWLTVDEWYTRAHRPKSCCMSPSHAGR